MSTRRAAWWALVIVVSASACASPPSPTTEMRRHQALEIARDETWMARELRRVRTYRHLDRAYRLTSAGDLQEAAEEFRRYLAIDPVDAQVRFDYLIVLHRLQRHDDVIREAGRILASHPGFAPALLYRALAHQARGDRDAAARDFTSVADRSDGDPDQQIFALTMAVDLALENGALGAALAGAERLVRARPVLDNHLRHGQVLERMGRLADADRAFETALRVAQHPGDRVRVLEARAVLAEKRRDWAQARRDLLALLQVDARNPRVRERLATVLYASADYRAGVQELRRVVSQVDGADDRHRILMALGHGYAKLGKTQEAFESFRHAAALRADAPTLAALGEALARAGRPLEAAEALTPVADRDASGNTHLKIATLYVRSRRWHDALHHLAASAAADKAGPIQHEVYKQQGFIYYTLERYADARRAFERSLEHGVADAHVYVALGETCMKLNAFADAVAYLKRALALTDAKTSR